jgi:hypothetical protein
VFKILSYEIGFNHPVIVLCQKILDKIRPSCVRRACNQIPKIAYYFEYKDRLLKTYNRPILTMNMNNFAHRLVDDVDILGPC